MDPEPPPDPNKPRVLKRVYKIEVRRPRRLLAPTNSTGSNSSGENNSIRSRKMSFKDYDRDTDSEIFALGDAFQSGNFCIDDFLKEWSGKEGVKIETFTSTNGGQLEPNEGSGQQEDGQGEGAVTGEPTIKAKVPDDKIGKVKVPSIKRPTDFNYLPLSVDGLPSDMFNKAKLASEKGTNRKTTIKRADSMESVKSGVPETPPNTPVAPFAIQLGLSSLSPLQEKNETNDTPPSEKSPENKVNRSPYNKYNGNKARKSVGNAYEAHETTSLLSFHGSDGDDEDKQKDQDVIINIDEQDEYEEENWFEDKDIVFGSAFRRKSKMIKFRNMVLKSIHKASECKGTIGMTASEVNAPGQETLPAIAQIVMSYNKMLDEDCTNFVETLFRAVKLNRVDVVKILCQLVRRKKLSLSDPEMREQESSATCLHVALLYNHEKIVEHLISMGDPALMMATYTNEDYKNQTALHVAVANGNNILVEKLLCSINRKDRRTLLNTIANGRYFKHHHVDGQLCLSAAAWSGNGEVLRTLAKHGANFALKNLEGDTLMHRIVILSADHPDNMDYQKIVGKIFNALGVWAKQCHYNTQIEDQIKLEQTQKQIVTFQKLLNIRNNDGFTPFALAASRGSHLLVYFMNLERITKIPQTKLGSISWVTYDVTDISSFACGTYNKFSVLHILAHNGGQLSRHAHLDSNAGQEILDTEPIKSMLNSKWKVYRLMYIAWCLIHIFYIVAFTYCTLGIHSLDFPTKARRPSKFINSLRACQRFRRNADLFPSLNISGIIDLKQNATTLMENIPKIYYIYGVFLFNPIFVITTELLDLLGNWPYSISFMRNQSLLTKITKRIQAEWTITGNGPYRLVNMGHSVFALLWYWKYINREKNQEIMLAMSLLLGWIFVLFFTRACRVTSRFSIMIQKMFFRDLMYFLTVYIILLLAFSFAYLTMYSKYEMTLALLGTIFYYMMNIVTDLEEKITIEEPDHPLFSKLLLILYAVVAVILLMNMLIAMMNTSYETVRITRCNLWKQQQLSIMMMMERRLLWCKFLCRKSESNIWCKEWDEEIRAYLDVTETQKNSTR